MPSRSRLFSCLVAAMAIGCTSCSKPLNRDEAANLVRASEPFSKPVLKWGTNGFLPAGPDRFDRTLEKAGITSIGRTVWETSSKFTPKGEAASKPWKKSGGGCEIPIAIRSFDAITAVAEESGGKEATVKFTWKFGENPAIGNLDGVDYTTVREGTAKMRLYDSGWRLEKVDLVKENPEL